MDQSISPENPSWGRIDGVPAWRFAARVGWVAVRLVIIYYVGQAGATFFYQAF